MARGATQGDIILVPIRRKACFYEIVREIFYFAVEDAVCFGDGLLFIPWNVFWQLSRFDCVTRRAFVTPLSEETLVITPLTHRHLEADESRAEAKGVGDAKG